MNKLQELKAEIARIEKEEADKKKAEYQYLVGNCVHPAHTSYKKIISIDRVHTDEYGDEIVFDCVDIYFDNRGDEYNSDASINLQSWGQGYIEDLQKQIISPEVFNNALDACTDLIKRKAFITLPK